MIDGCQFFGDRESMRKPISEAREWYQCGFA